jgi:hypothetical protein
MCEMHVTMKLWTALCCLSDADSYLFPNQRNSCSCSLLNVCTTAQQYIGTNVRLWKEKLSRKFKRIWCEFNTKWWICTCLKSSLHTDDTGPGRYGLTLYWSHSTLTSKQTVTWLKRLVANLWPRRIGFVSKTFHLGYMVDKMWHCNRFLPQYFRSTLSALFGTFSILIFIQSRSYHNKKWSIPENLQKVMPLRKLIVLWKLNSSFAHWQFFTFSS